MTHRLVDAVPGVSAEELGAWVADAESGYDADQLVYRRSGPGVLLEQLDADVREAILERLDPASAVPLPEQLSGILRAALAALAAA